MDINTKEYYLNKIKKISKISIYQICLKLKINRSNLLNGKAKKEDYKIVYDEIIKQYERTIKE